MTRRVLSVARWLSEALVALLLFLMMTVTVVDVSGRYLIHRPLIGSAEMIRYMLVMVIFISLPVVTEQDKHISISLVDSVLGARLNRLRRGLIRLIAGIAMVTVGFYMWRYAGLLVQNQDDENLGYGELLKKGRHLLVKNLLDRGDFLRRER